LGDANRVAAPCSIPDTDFHHEEHEDPME